MRAEKKSQRFRTWILGMAGQGGLVVWHAGFVGHHHFLCTQWAAAFKKLCDC